MQYLCRLWRSHPGPVHTQGLSGPLLACRLSQGTDGGGVGGHCGDIVEVDVGGGHCGDEDEWEAEKS